MANLYLLSLVAVIGGIAVALQAQLMGLLDKQIGTLESVFITYGSGGLLIGLVILYLRGGNLSLWQSVPWYAFLSGVIGLIIVASIGFSVPRLGLVTAFTLMVAAQFIVASVLDHYGFLGAEIRQLNLQKVLGMLTVLVGVWLTVRS
ncbi:MAG: DMT family transporter [Sedimenticola sp.]|uniref:DMT family transporter n=1 Tax=Sedimenticola thiotaurini TaxID=1543721 RepID=A0A558CHC7_9GAMM|nr:DMT family transporter [Sedimenticola sp.]TVT48092.1 MAG: DMT family transporter [Sedimenticola thiotaurini]MCW8948260.1 DMT family transporter [Sedimenticola sp.]MCW8950410.1 DMT family transporter [Sedimenticola sp.]MCW8974857.1 DMT family transporter [Sedimenticola sp.]